MNSSTKLFRIFGIDINIHISWWFVFALLTWSLSSTFFPNFYPKQTTTTYWIMGVLSAVLLFVSVLLHELAHSLVAKAKQIQVEKITLFFFGGVASITDEDLKPQQELPMALAGPVFSLILSGLFFFLYRLDGHVILTGIMYYLFQLNLILALFNLIPGYPLDGGRALRAILNAYYKNLRKATNIAVKGGKLFAIILMLLGILGLITGTLNGLWFLFLGGFLYYIAGASYEQVVIKETISPFPVKQILSKKYLSLNPEWDLAQALKRAYHSDLNCFIVKDKQKYLGILDLKRIDKTPLEVQKKMKVNQLMVPKTAIQSLDITNNGYQAFKSVISQNLDLIPVLSKDKIVGVVYKKTLMHLLVMELKYNISANLKDKRN